MGDFFCLAIRVSLSRYSPKCFLLSRSSSVSGTLLYSYVCIFPSSCTAISIYDVVVDDGLMAGWQPKCYSSPILYFPSAFFTSSSYR